MTTGDDDLKRDQVLHASAQTVSDESGWDQSSLGGAAGEQPASGSSETEAAAITTKAAA